MIVVPPSCYQLVVFNVLSCSCIKQCEYVCCNLVMLLGHAWLYVWAPGNNLYPCLSSMTSQARAHTHRCTCIHTRTYTCTHTHMHTHTIRTHICNTHTHTYTYGHSHTSNSTYITKELWDNKATKNYVYAFRVVRGLIIDMVLATDMSCHFEQLKIMKNLLSSPDA